MSISTSSSSSSMLRTIIKSAASATALSGAGMAVMGLGMIDIDPKLGNVALVFTHPLNIPLKPFLVFVAATKILSVLRLWNVTLESIPKTLAWIGLAAPATCAIYGHYKAEGSWIGSIPPTLYMCNLAFCYYLESKADNETKTKNN